MMPTCESSRAFFIGTNQFLARAAAGGYDPRLDRGQEAHWNSSSCLCGGNTNPSMSHILFWRGNVMRYLGIRYEFAVVACAVLIWLIASSPNSALAVTPPGTILQTILSPDHPNSENSFGWDIVQYQNTFF